MHRFLYNLPGWAQWDPILSLRWSKVSSSMRTAALFCLAAGLSLGATPDGSPVALRCGRLLNVESGNLIDNAVILTAGGKIQDVGPGLAIPSGVPIIQLPDATCLPGLIDVHVHLTVDPMKQGYQALGIS